MKGKNVGIDRFYHGFYCRGYRFTLWLAHNKFPVPQAPQPDGGIGIPVTIGAGKDTPGQIPRSYGVVDIVPPAASCKDGFVET